MEGEWELKESGEMGESSSSPKVFMKKKKSGSDKIVINDLKRSRE